MRWNRVILAIALLATAAMFWESNVRMGETPWHPTPVGDEPGERDADFQSRRQAWIESLHRHAPAQDWHALDSAFRGLRTARVQAQREIQLAAGAGPDDLRRVETPAVSGNWRERGSGNQAGRITGAIYDAANNRLTAVSSGGNVWRADRATLAWNSPDDSASFQSNGFLERLGGTDGERLLVASDTPLGVFRSDNGGQTFTNATGTNSPNPWYTTGLATRDDTAEEVYLTRVHYDFTAPAAWRTMLFASSDRGASFAQQGIVGEPDRVALFSPRYDSSEVYLLTDATLKRIVSASQSLQTISTVPVSPIVADGDRVVLAGGVASGQVFLYAFYSRDSHTDVYRSLDGGSTWQLRTPVPTSLFGGGSATTSTRDPNFVYAGGVDLYRSTDGGASWVPVNSWGDYYADPANKLHADIPRVQVWLDAANTERVYVSTDGGLYESTDHLATVHNLSLTGLNVSQYYSTYTQRIGVQAILAGAQDQGYQKALAPGGGVVGFEQAISGDYGHLTSSDGGAKLWMVYPGFAMLDTTPAMSGQGGLSFWNYAANGFVGALWMAPIVADPSNPQRALLAGGTLGAGGHRVIELNYNGSAISATEGSFNFGSQITALAYSAQTPGERYAVTAAGHFFNDPGTGWIDTASNLPANHYFYGNVILSDPSASGTVYVGGAGYSNPAVFVSTNHGASFAPMSTGLPSTLVFDLAISPDGLHLFAATEVGAFYYDRAQSRWVDLGGLGAPDQSYWAVDYVPSAGVARFATYGRGIWDFTVAGDIIFRNGFD